MKTKILICGGTGFIGKNLAIKLSKNKNYIITLLSRSKLSKNFFKKNINFIKCDITNKKNLEKKVKKNFEYIINLSGNIDHKKKIQTLKTHFNGCKNILNFSLNSNLKLFIQIGSSLEYGNLTSPLTEDLNCKPVSYYGTAKYKATNYLMKFGKKKNLPFIILRPFQIYGPFQKFDRLIPQIIKSSLKNKNFKCTNGNQFRDYFYIDDFTNLIKKILKKKKIKSNVFNVGFGKPIKVRDVIEKITRIIKKGKPNYGSIRMRKDEILNLYPDTKKVKKFFNWSPKISINIGLKKTIRHYYETL